MNENNINNEVETNNTTIEPNTTEPVVETTPVVEEQPVQPTEPVMPVEPSATSTIPVQNVATPPIQPIEEEPKKKKSILPALIVIVIILAALCGASYYFLVVNTNNPIYNFFFNKSGNTGTITTTTTTAAPKDYEKEYEGTDFKVFVYDLKNENACIDSFYKNEDIPEESKYVFIVKNVKLKDKSYTFRYENIPPVDNGYNIEKLYIDDKLFSTNERLAGLGDLCAYNNYMVTYSAWEGLPGYEFFDAEGNKVFNFSGWADKYNDGILTIKEYKDIDTTNWKAIEVTSELDMKSDKLERKNSTEKEYICEEGADAVCG